VPDAAEHRVTGFREDARDGAADIAARAGYEDAIQKKESSFCEQKEGWSPAQKKLLEFRGGALAWSRPRPKRTKSFLVLASR